VSASACGIIFAFYIDWKENMQSWPALSENVEDYESINLSESTELKVHNSMGSPLFLLCTTLIQSRDWVSLDESPPEKC